MSLRIGKPCPKRQPVAGVPVDFIVLPVWVSGWPQGKSSTRLNHHHSIAAGIETALPQNCFATEEHRKTQKGTELAPV
jgi:hypothetical protein